MKYVLWKSQPEFTCRRRRYTSCHRAPSPDRPGMCQKITDWGEFDAYIAPHNYLVYTEMQQRYDWGVIEDDLRGVVMYV